MAPTRFPTAIDFHSFCTRLSSRLLGSRPRAFLSKRCSPMTSSTMKTIICQWFCTSPSLKHSLNKADLTLLRSLACRRRRLPTSITRPAISTFLPWPMPWVCVCQMPISFSKNPSSFPPASRVFNPWYALLSSSKRVNYLVSHLLHLNFFSLTCLLSRTRSVCSHSPAFHYRKLGAC